MLRRSVVQFCSAPPVHFPTALDTLDANTEEYERLTGLMDQDQERVQELGGKPRMLQDCY